MPEETIKPRGTKRLSLIPGGKPPGKVRVTDISGKGTRGNARQVGDKSEVDLKIKNPKLFLVKDAATEHVKKNAVEEMAEEAAEEGDLETDGEAPGGEGAQPQTREETETSARPDEAEAGSEQKPEAQPENKKTAGSSANTQKAPDSSTGTEPGQQPAAADETPSEGEPTDGEPTDAPAIGNQLPVPPEAQAPDETETDEDEQESEEAQPAPAMPSRAEPSASGGQQTQTQDADTNQNPPEPGAPQNQGTPPTQPPQPGAPQQKPDAQPGDEQKPPEQTQPPGTPENEQTSPEVNKEPPKAPAPVPEPPVAASPEPPIAPPSAADDLHRNQALNRGQSVGFGRPSREPWIAANNNLTNRGASASPSAAHEPPKVGPQGIGAPLQMPQANNTANPATAGDDEATEADQQGLRQRIAARFENQRAKLRRDRASLERQLNTLENKEPEAKLSKLMRIVRLFMPGVYARVTGSLNAGKNVAAKTKIAALQARITALNTAKNSLRVAKLGACLIDAGRITFETALALAETIIGTIIVVLFAVVIIPFVAAVCYIRDIGTLTGAIAQAIKEVNKIIEPLKKELEMEKKKVKVRGQIQQINDTLAGEGQPPIPIDRNKKKQEAPQTIEPAQEQQAA